MYLKGHAVRQHHEEKYGSLSEFGYHDFIPEFTAEHFDASQWVDLLVNAGAKFVGPVAVHHDGFAMWDSASNPWNSADKGPKKDIMGEITQEARKRDMKVIATFHHSRNVQRNQNKPDYWEGYNSHYPYHPDFHTSSKDPVLSQLYGNIPLDEFNQLWATQINEVVDQYQPDIIWFDSWFNFIPDTTRLPVFANYLNNAKKNKQEVVLGYKQSDLPDTVGVRDIESGGKRDISDKPWMTDFTLSEQSWSYVEGQTYKKASTLVRNIIDVVSKNGTVLLNILPKSDGTIPQAQQDVLLRMGKWMDDFGEAIYSTRPWDLFGVGSGVSTPGKHGGQSLDVEYNYKDYRFTQSKDGKTMYLTLLGKPPAGEVLEYYLLARHRYRPHGDIKRITHLSTKKEVEFEFVDTHFSITVPNDIELDDIANVFKFELADVRTIDQ
jgi:alpha-L-fucosidase